MTMAIGTRATFAVLVTALLELTPAGRPATAAVNRWSTSGPGAGFVLAMDASPSQPNTVYAGVYGYDFGSGMYKSTDHGQRWDPVPTGLGDRNVTEVKVAPSSSDLVYVGTYSRAVYKSVDGGAHWIHTNWTDPFDTSVMALAVDPTDSDTVYASAEYTDEPYGAGLFKTTDGGVTWTDLTIAVNYAYVYSLAVDPADPEVVYAGTGGDGVLKSSNGGATWHRRNQGLAARTINALQIDPQDPITLYAAGDDYYTPSKRGIYKSTDAGHSWSILDMSTFGPYRTVPDFAIDPLSPKTLYASGYGPGHSRYGYYQGGGVFKTTDGGQTWAATSQGLFDMLVFRLAIDPADPSTLYAGTSSGVFKSTDGAGTWSSASQGLLAATAEDVAIDGTAVYAGASQAGVFKSTDGGVRWDLARGGMIAIDAVQSLAADPLAPGTLYAGTGKGVYSEGRGVYKTSDGGQTWVSVRNGLTNGNVRDIAVDGAGRVYAGTDDGVFESTDGGQSWTQVLHPSPGFVIAAVAADPELADVVYAAGWVGGVYKTSDGGSHWAEMDSGLGDETRQSLAVDPTDSQVLYLGDYCYNSGETCVYKSSDGGASWQPMDDGMKGTGVEGLAIDPNAPSTVYAGTVDLGVYRSTDGGASWAPFNDGLHNNDVTSVAVDAAGTVYAATYGSGVFVYAFG